MNSLEHPILKKSFAIIDQEIGKHHFSDAEYAILRRIIHSTADFEFLQLLHCSPRAIEIGIMALRSQVPIITDVGMVKQGIMGMVSKTFNNPLIAAVEEVSVAKPGKTRTETGLLNCFSQYPQGIYVIGNAPTALLALCAQCAQTTVLPALIIGVPVGFVSVVESKQALQNLAVPQIFIQGRKGGSTVAAAIVNALLMLAWESETV